MEFVNGNDHPVRVNRPRSGQPDELVRLIPGQVVQADGAFADNLQATPGVRSAGDDDAERWEQISADRAGVPTAGYPHSRTGIEAALDVGISLRRALIAAPLQRVVGDDQAPLGPGSGTVTTKLDVVAAGGEVERQAFAPGEAIGVGPVEGAGEVDPRLGGVAPTGAEAHNTQLAAQQEANEIAREVVIPGSDGEPFDGDEEDAEESVEPPYEPHNADVLLAEAQRRELQIEGTGRDGNVTKPDVVKALEADDAAKATQSAP